MDGDQLHAWRRRMKLTQDELGARLRVSRQTVNSWEAGRHPCPVDLQSRLEGIENVQAGAAKPVVPKWVTPSTAPHLYERSMSRTAGVVYSWKPEHPIMLLGEACKVRDETVPEGYPAAWRVPWTVLASEEYQVALARYRSSLQARHDAMNDQEWLKEMDRNAKLRREKRHNPDGNNS